MAKEKNDISLEEFSKDDFTLVQLDSKIHDQKFETKPTTFFKDALKRFKKNKSSVVGSIIIGIILLLAIFVPIIDRNDINSIDRNQRYLQPKLFEVNPNNPGFWDGTKKHTHLIYDTDNETPAGYQKSCVYKLEVDSESTKIDQPASTAKGGSLMYTCESSLKENVAVLNSPVGKFSSTSNCTLTLSLKDEDNALGLKQSEYRVLLLDSSDSTKSYVLKDWSKDYGELSFNISNVLATNSLTELSGKISIELKKLSDVDSYLLINSAKFSCDESYESYENLTQNLSFDNPSKVSLSTLEGNPESFWQSTGRKNVYQVEVYYCSFYYDTYKAIYDADEYPYAISDLNKFKNDGLCDFDLSLIKYNSTTGEYEGIQDFIDSYVVLDSSCPVDTFIGVSLFNSVTHKPTTISCGVYRYKTMGYKKMPRFLFGTDNNGQDLFKKCCVGLRQSFALAIIIAAFCFIFGLIWGSISGYFGGYVDLLMERFCDILGRVPDLLVISLFTLHLGSGKLTFILALVMTGWMGTASLTRTQFYRFKGREYVLASRTLGASDTRLIFKHILPNSMGTIITSSVFMITSVIRSEASFAYLHIGLNSSNSFGVILSNNQQYISTYPFLIVVPSVIMALMMISFNLFGNGLRDAMNPSLKGSE